MTDMDCPYCGADQEVCHDEGQGYEEGVKHEHTCQQCGKTFVFQTYISFDYEPSKADCLNGSPHQFKMSKTWPRQYSKMQCQHCDYKRQATSDELATHGIKENT